MQQAETTVKPGPSEAPVGKTGGGEVSLRRGVCSDLRAVNERRHGGGGWEG